MFCPLQQHCIYFRKELPYAIPKRKTTPKDYTAKYPMAVILHKKKVVLFEESLLGGLIERGNERDFLKDLAKQRFGIELSVRAAYKTWIENRIKYSLHRCYILLGEEVLEKVNPIVIEAQDVMKYLFTSGIAPSNSGKA
jgi:adenine-specific DNA glycosylase